MKDSETIFFDGTGIDDLRKELEEILNEINVSIIESSLSSDMKRSCTKEVHAMDKHRRGAYI